MAITRLPSFVIDSTSSFTFANANVTSNISSANLEITGTVNLQSTSLVNLGNVSNVKINGGTTGQVLSTDGVGNLSWVNQAETGSTSNIFNGNTIVDIPSANSNILISVNSTANVVEISNIGILVNGVGNFTSTLSASNIVIGTGGNITGANVISANLLTGTLTTSAQPNITSLGELVDLTVLGNTSTGNLRTDNLLYANGSPYVFTTNAAGTNTQIQFNDGNLFAGSANLTFDKTTNTLSVTNIIANGSQLTDLNASNIVGQVANALVAGTVYTNAQPNITSLGTLTDLTSNGNVDFGNTTLINLGSVSKIKISGGTTGYVLSTDGNGNLSWTEKENAGQTIIDSFVGNGVQTTFTLSVTPASIDVTTVNYDGVILLKSDYILVGDQVTLSDAPANNSKIEITTVTPGTGGGTIGGGVSSINITVDEFTGDGSTDSFTLTTTPLNENFTFVTIGGTLQPKTVYSLSSNVITFSSAPPNGALIEVNSFINSGGGTGNSGLTWNILSSNTTAAAFNGYFIDVSSGPVSLTLPSTPVLGDTIRINDLAGAATTNNITILRNGNKIQGVDDDLVIDYNNSTVELIFSNTTYGWKAMEL